jgi:hypothetical protein
MNCFIFFKNIQHYRPGESFIVHGLLLFTILMVRGRWRAILALIVRHIHVDRGVRVRRCRGGSHPGRPRLAYFSTEGSTRFEGGRVGDRTRSHIRELSGGIGRLFRVGGEFRSTPCGTFSASLVVMSDCPAEAIHLEAKLLLPGEGFNVKLLAEGPFFGIFRRVRVPIRPARVFDVREKVIRG